MLDPPWSPPGLGAGVWSLPGSAPGSEWGGSAPWRAPSPGSGGGGGGTSPRAGGQTDKQTPGPADRRRRRRRPRRRTLRALHAPSPRGQCTGSLRPPLEGPRKVVRAQPHFWHPQAKASLSRPGWCSGQVYAGRCAGALAEVGHCTGKVCMDGRRRGLPSANSVSDGVFRRGKPSSLAALA